MAKELGVKTHILRYWEEQFPMLSPLKRAGGRRHYRPSDVRLLQTINRLLNSEGYTIKGARKYLASGIDGDAGSGPVVSQAAHASDSGSTISVSDLMAIRQRLSQALAAA